MRESPQVVAIGSDNIAIYGSNNVINVYIVKSEKEAKKLTGKNETLIYAKPRSGSKRANPIDT